MIIINLYLLSLYAPVPKENKFMDYLAFRQALYKALFQYSTGVVAAGATESLPVVGSMNLVIPPGDTVPVINNPDTEDRAELVAVAAIVYIVGKILIITIANLSVEH